VRRGIKNARTMPDDFNDRENELSRAVDQYLKEQKLRRKLQDIEKEREIKILYNE
jgi:hypothetical protein